MFLAARCNKGVDSQNAHPRPLLKLAAWDQAPSDNPIRQYRSTGSRFAPVSNKGIVSSIIVLLVAYRWPER
jgi:hypothetical protein